MNLLKFYIFSINHFKNFVILFCLISITNLSSQQTEIINNSGEQVIKKTLNNRLISVSPVIVHEHFNKNSLEQKDNITSFNWQLKFTASGKVFKDVSFCNLNVGYIVTELGAVYKTTNGGNSWEIKMNLGFPYYWYGVHALSPDTVVIAGFNNQANIRSGVVKWTFNGGNNWSGNISVSIPQGVGWLSKIHFFDSNKGIVMAEFSGGAYYTINGGKDSSSWNYVQINQDLAWFAGNIDVQGNGNCYATGIHFAKSTNFGVNWISGPSADNVFDGGVDFLDNNNLKGWTGGGQISPSVSGWTHRTLDGGSSWSPRLYDYPFPIRTVKFFNDSIGFAAGGNVFQDVGGIYSTINGGLNWTLDVNAFAEMFSLDYKQASSDSIDVWCVGSTGGSSGYTGKLYKGRFAILVGTQNYQSSIPINYKLYQNYPNPFNPTTTIKFSLPNPYNGGAMDVKLVIYNILGKVITSLTPFLEGGQGGLLPGTYEIEWNASDYPSGIYFYTLSSGAYKETKKMIILK
jgi:photosystem II stability/assembly factor-like uncharacterized protein